MKSERSRREPRNPSVHGRQGDDRNRTGATFPSSAPTCPGCASLAEALVAEREDHAGTLRRAQEAWTVAEQRWDGLHRAIELLDADSFAVAEIEPLRLLLRTSKARARRAGA